LKVALMADSKDEDKVALMEKYLVVPMDKMKVVE
jgi:hypothetical protein